MAEDGRGLYSACRSWLYLQEYRDDFRNYCRVARRVRRLRRRIRRLHRKYDRARERRNTLQATYERGLESINRMGGVLLLDMDDIEAVRELRDEGFEGRVQLPSRATLRLIEAQLNELGIQIHTI